jgi:hypothetical protein
VAILVPSEDVSAAALRSSFKSPEIGSDSHAVTGFRSMALEEKTFNSF